MLVVVGVCWMVSERVVVVVVSAGSLITVVQEEKTIAPAAITGSRRIAFFIVFSSLLSIPIRRNLRSRMD